MEHSGRHCKKTHVNRSPCQECYQCPCETQSRIHFKCHIESKHDGTRYHCKDCEAPINGEARLKCGKCEQTFEFRTLVLKH